MVKWFEYLCLQVSFLDENSQKFMKLSPHFHGRFHTAIITFNLKLFQFLFKETQIFWLWVVVHAAKSTKTPMTTCFSTLWAS